VRKRAPNYAINLSAAQKRAPNYPISLGVKAREQALNFSVSRPGEIPGPMVPYRWPLAQVEISARSSYLYVESPDGRRLKLIRPKIIFGIFY
jgi:hypothetical protein